MDHTVPHLELYGVPWTTEEFHGMPYRWLGRSGLRASNVGLGTWKIGYPETGDGSRVGAEAAFEIFDRAVDLGVTFWDTANRYNSASGNSERIIGTWLKQNPNQRRNLVLATKMFGGMDGQTPNHSRLSRGNILDSVYASLERLQVSTIDLLYFHAFDPLIPPEESLSAVEDLISRDLVRYLGVSNFTVGQLALYRAIEASTSIRCRVIAVQNQFDLLHGEDPAYLGVLDYAASHGIAFVAWSPLARGLLTERYLDLSKVGPGDRLHDEGTLERDTGGNSLERVRALAALAHGWELELSQLVIAYMLALPGMGPIIASVSSVKQVESNAIAGKIVLSATQQEQVRQCLMGVKP